MREFPESGLPEPLLRAHLEGCFQQECDIDPVCAGRDEECNLC